MNLSCSCGARFRDMGKEAMHRHNFPLLCRKKRVKLATVTFTGLVDIDTVNRALACYARQFPCNSPLNAEINALADRASAASERWIEKLGGSGGIPK